MAEVVRSVTTTTKSSISSRSGSKVGVESKTEVVKVRSFTEDRMTVSSLLDFADAVRQVGMDPKTLIHKTSSRDGHLTGLNVDEIRDLTDQGEAVQA